MPFGTVANILNTDQFQQNNDITLMNRFHLNCDKMQGVNKMKANSLFKVNPILLSPGFILVFILYLFESTSSADNLRPGSCVGVKQRWIGKRVSRLRIKSEGKFRNGPDKSEGKTDKRKP